MTVLKFISVIGLYLAASETLEYVIVRGHAAETFPPKLGWRFLRWTIIGSGLATIIERLHNRPLQPGDTPLWLAVAFLVFGAVWPRTVSVDSDGISSCSTFGFRRQHIPWAMVDRVDSDWEEVQTRFGFRFMGTRVQVLGREGKRITHCAESSGIVP